MKTRVKKWIVAILILLIMSTSLRLVWMNYLATLDYDERRVAVQGLLDLRDFSFTDKETMSLNGEWEFYLNQHLDANSIADGTNFYTNVPGDWNGEFEEVTESNRFHYGTYRLQILVDENIKQTFGLRINEIRTASAVYVNGELMKSIGKVGTSLSEHEGKRIPYSLELEPSHGLIDIIIHVSNDTGKGGIVKPIRFGTSEAIELRTTISVSLQLLLCIVLLIHSLYAVLLYFLGTRNKGLLYFSLLLICAIMSVLVADDKLLFAAFEVSYVWSMKLISLSYIGAVAFIPLMIHHLFNNQKNKLLNLFAAVCILYSFIILIGNTSVITSISIFISIIMLTSVILSIHILLKATKKNEDITFMLLACLFLAINIFWAIYTNWFAIETIHYPFDLIFVMLSFAAFWFQRFFKATESTKQLAERLLQEDKKKDEFLVNTSHELRNPLHGIINLAQTMLEDQNQPLNQEHQKKLSLLIDVSKRLSHMLNDLIDVTRLKEDTIRLQLKEIDLPSIVTGVFDMTIPLLNGKKISFQIEIDPHFPTVYGDENRLIQILFNLVHNAVKYTDEGTITVRATRKKNMVSIQVIDTGIGIDEHAMEMIFNPYEQIEAHSKQASGGFGLGLNICKQLIELHGGRLTVTSKLEVGTVFSFTIPLYDNNNMSVSNSSESITYYKPDELTVATLEDDIIFVDNNKIRILAVDDEHINLTILKNILEAREYDVTIVTSASEALAKIEKNRYDLVISDVMMPIMSGYELTKKIRGQFTLFELPILLLTARSRPEDLFAGFQVGANDYVTKPVDHLELEARVRALTKLKLSIDEHIRMEAAWLQSQIQPHFLFNTLNSIAALGVSDINKMQTLLEQLSHYLRLSFNFHNSARTVPLIQELELVRSYLYIEKERFGERLQIEWAVDTQALIYIPPLSIQPLVENAVKHGILNKASGGTILIQTNINEDACEIIIQDDGEGMSKEKIQELFKIPTNSHNKKSVGLRNVHRRLKQIYNSGLTVESYPNQGTTIKFTVPLSKIRDVGAID